MIIETIIGLPAGLLLGWTIWKTTGAEQKIRRYLYQ